MESYPPPPAPPPLQSQTNGLGIAGFVISLVGIFTCVLCPVGLILSLVALKRQPRGLAIAGAVIGAVGTLALGAIIIGLLANPGYVETLVAIGEGHTVIEKHRTESGSLPGNEDGNRLIEHLEDGWGNPLSYELDGERYVVRSAGPDGEFGTSDDLPP
jgi:hypothetical protein